MHCLCTRLLRCEFSILAAAQDIFWRRHEACGHQCYGVNAPPDILSEVENRVYSEMLAALASDQYVSPLLIERFAPMSLPYRDLDAITAFWICFNRHRQLDEWGVSEWRFFVGNALSHLSIGGFLHLELYSHPERYDSLEWYDKETLDFFRSVGTVPTRCGSNC